MIEVTTMLSEFLAVTTLVVTDVDEARRFYAEQLGLTLLEETPGRHSFRRRQGVTAHDPAWAAPRRWPDGRALRGR
jgi:catechol 2,3-dioxygenase-like lactoylglutathione lyase family enzyme